VVTALAVLLACGTVKPMRSLTRAARALREGDFDGAHVEVLRSDEIGMLVHAFNTMAKVLKERERERDVFGRAVFAGSAGETAQWRARPRWRDALRGRVVLRHSRVLHDEWDHGPACRG
jgi:HAMP domain-containing protein